MSIITWQPMTDPTQYRRQFDSIYNSLFVPRVFRSERAWNPLCHTSENDNEYTISVELPGLDEKDIGVQLLGDVLTISANRALKVAEKERTESSSDSFVRSVTLPDNIDQSKIEATYAKGLLTVKMPKFPLPKAKSIAIKTA
jgi:HSP20 family protein